MFRNQTLSGLLSAVILLATTPAANAALWQETGAETRGIDTHARTYQLDESTLRNRLQLVPHQALQDFSHEIELPMPDGSLGRFQIVESPILADQLAADFPSYKSYKLFGIDDPTAVGRADISTRGFHALLHTAQGRLFIDPDPGGATQFYQARSHSGQAGAFSCGTNEIEQQVRPLQSALNSGVSARVPMMLLQYEIAVAATDEYVTAVAGAGNVAAAQLAINTVINRVNLTYERDHGIVFQIVAGNQNLIENAGNVAAVLTSGQPFSNSNGFLLLSENQQWIDSNVPANIAGYDIGHVFSTGGGGIARLASVCDALTKAQGVTGLPDPTGQIFEIDFVAHEIGHQFAANHTFNGTTGNCAAPNRNPGTAFEPGSGSSIMGYASICGAEDIQNNFPLESSDDTFHAGSIAEVDAFVGGAGGACATVIATTPAMNNDPMLTPIPNYTIPPGTPFRLEASATDAESGTALLYQWDQMDAGSATTSTTLGEDLGDNALFRTYEPSLELAQRDFPALGTQVQGLYDTAEALPCDARTVNMRVTVRDGDSGQATDDVQLTVATPTAGFFEVTSQEATTNIAADFTLTWNVADTSLAPVNCANVMVELLAFDDANYTNYTAHTLVPTTPNNGSAVITHPANSITAPARGRIKVSCIGNVFYALSKGDLSITGVSATQYDNDDNPTVFNNNGTTSAVAPTCLASGGGGSGGGTGGGSRGSGSGTIDPWWMLLVAAAAIALRRRGQILQ